VRNRRPEHRHHRIPHKLLHRPPMPLDHLPQPGVIRIRARTSSESACSDAAVNPTRSQKRTGDNLPLLLHRNRRLLGQRRRAERTERKVARDVLTAAGTRRHPPSLGPLTQRQQRPHRPLVVI
jgi:hypothetical protein